MRHTESIYKNTHIHWHINLGIPSKNYDDQSGRKTFQNIAMAAWRTSLLDTAITFNDVRSSLAEAKNHIVTKGKDIGPDNLEWLHPDFVNAHPEVIMEVVGYARSPLRTNGLHLIVDVGANTLDSATFIIHSHEDEDIYPLLETRVEKFGTMMLHNLRIQTLKNSIQKSLQQRNSIDPTSPLPDYDHYKMFVEEDVLSDNDARFFQECTVIIGGVIRDTKNRRDPYSGAWEDGLPVFLCGGGGRLPVYREMINDLGLRIAKNLTDFKGFVIKKIPKPDQLYAPDLMHYDYDRLAVAYGLSFTSDEIGEVIPESKVSDIHKKDNIRNLDDRYVDKDMC